jgi:hypothetical protein
MGMADPTAWSDLDGFSPGGPILVHLPGATSAGLPDIEHIEASVAEDSPTILLDAETGERVPHFAELDAAASDPERAALFVRPARRLRDGARHIVALRGIAGADGQPLAPSEAFVALRDGLPIDDPDVDSRRPLYTDIFARLDEAGIARGDLQLAWDFTTASTQSHTGTLVQMRDEVLAAIGPDGPTYTITSVDEDWIPDTIAFRIRGTFDVPMYLDRTTPDAALRTDATGRPVAEFSTRRAGSGSEAPITSRAAGPAARCGRPPTAAPPGPR